MKRDSVWRYLTVAFAFCLVIVIYLGRMFYVQISGKDDNYNDNTVTRTVVVPAVRGEIFDRNGKTLVSNRKLYSLVLPYSSFAALDQRSANDTALALLRALDHTGEGNLHTEIAFPFDGAYPNYTFSASTLEGDTREAYYLNRVLGDLGLNRDSDVATIVNRYVADHALLSTYSNDARIWNDADVDRLIRLYYDMDARRFAVAGEYSVAENVSFNLVTYVEELGLPSATFSVKIERVYQYPGYASHILGTVGPIYAEEWEYYNEQGYQMSALVGKSGCEYAFEEYLHGIDGIMKITEDKAGNIIATEWVREPVSGCDVRLTIDIELQIAAEDGLANNVSNVGGNCNAGAAVAMNPDTFEVLAIASYPTYDLTYYNALYGELSQDAAKPLLNRALSGSYAPGSTFKLGVAVSAMMEGKINASSQITCNGRTEHYHRPTCSTFQNGTHGGAIDVTEAIADSCNTFFYELGYRLGIDKMNEYMKQFGFGQSTGLELGGISGILAGPDFRLENNYPAWMPGDVLSAAIGQSDNTASPLQLACYLSTLSNGGTRYSAHLLHSVYRFGATEPLYAYTQSDDTVLDRMDIPASVQNTIFAGMRDMIKGSSTASRNMASVPVTVGGKTGTAEVNGKDSNALFIGAAPYNDPEIVVSVVLEAGRSGTNATYTAGKILEKYYALQTQ